MVNVQGNYVEFRFYRPDARQVFVTGDFSAWRQHRYPMWAAGRGEWVLELMLPPGEYKFHYLADDQWFADYAAFGVEYGPFGLDSIVRVTPVKPARSLRIVDQVAAASSAA
jgi:1,4-alpha-glucan branching enzyme